ncbi:CBS domain-containing protein [Rhizobium tumorigenes]|uniref:CBS domain-containing protein n=1 Tax=Rhizobium tumorigenes TaxID=2041385 RepID=A0AAF1K984_9HYPH|nr:CBS domain-containing protein [Rhizobium tumorigenes]WFR94922.1 CBS domain-containing protein [Rhizobium tumorigenes]
MDDAQKTNKPLQTVTRGTFANDVLEIMQRENVSIVVVVDTGAIIGTVTDRDIAMKCLLSGKLPGAITAFDVMTLQPDGCIGKAMRRAELHIME